MVRFTNFDELTLVIQLAIRAAIGRREGLVLYEGAIELKTTTTEKDAQKLTKLLHKIKTSSTGCPKNL